MSTLWQRRVASRRTTEALTLTLLFAIALSGCFLSFGVMPGRPPMWAGVALSALACAALAWRRRWPFWVLAVTALCVVTVSALGHLVTAMLMSPLMVAQYSVSLRARRRAGWYAALVATAALVASGLFHEELRHQWLIGLVNPAAWVPLSAAFGSYVRVRREYAAARAEHIAREREEEARHRVVQDRMRIARELHDVVAHHLTLAHAQAGVATHLARTDPERRTRSWTGCRTPRPPPCANSSPPSACCARTPTPTTNWRRHRAWPGCPTWWRPARRPT
ncbi:histidine kinase dimerization/phosphoacceptor domain-containing protein [Streptomyces olivaceus]|uniref:histidine kinase dimerization/phosphoacceptor domain-containing protein n=1 Tax=Streptomyces TaxID=1883 RepID=UPI001FB5B694|nr:histidine kinase dimerization/phosphoacceptor domain-containing protein [Streptomyces sp. CB09030]UOG79547.1 histidine kinase dimerization/phosphoacceptor domain-containing protein [Streptomyces sp. CB09030]